MKNQITSFLIALSVSACANTMLPMDDAAQETTLTEKLSKTKNQSAFESYNPVERYAELLWVEQADPVSDALQALKQGDTKLWAYNTRVGPKIPGIATDAIQVVLQTHQVKIAAAMGDIVYGAKHLELKLKFIDYAKKYNNEIIKY